MRYDLEDDDPASEIDVPSGDDVIITPEKKQKLKYYLKPIEKVSYFFCIVLIQLYNVSVFLFSSKTS